MRDCRGVAHFAGALALTALGLGFCLRAFERRGGFLGSGVALAGRTSAR